MWLAGRPTEPATRSGSSDATGIGLISGLQHPQQLEQRTGGGAAPGADGLDRRRGAAAHHDSQAGQVAPIEIGLLQDGGEGRRRSRDVGDPLALDQVERSRRHEPIQQHRLGAGEDALDQREITPIQTERQPDQHDVVGCEPEIAVENASGRQRRVVAVHDPLWVAGGAGREGHAHDRVGIRPHRNEIRRGAGSRRDVIEAHHSRAGDATDDADRMRARGAAA